MQKSKEFILVAVIVVVLILGVAGGAWGLSNLDANLKGSQVHLENEFRSITPLPQATLAKYESYRNLQKGSARVSSNYLTSMGFDEIYKHYDSELRKNGWQYLSEEKIRDWEQDFGGKVVKYRKGIYIATLEYSGNTSYYGWTYGLSFSQ